MSVYLFTALASEAKPFIDRFKLKKRRDVHAFMVYQNDTVSLIVTGLGQTAMAAGVAYSLALKPCATMPILINIGIAGHATQALGTLFIADKISNNDKTKQYYPQLVISPPCASHTVITVNQVENDYSEAALYDMEALAFYEIASRFSSAELIHCFKVISDNQQHASEQIKPAQVSAWLSESVADIEKFIHALGQLSQQLPLVDIQHYAETIKVCHFTENQKIQLKAVLQKRQLLIKTPYSISTEKTAKAILQQLNHELAHHPFGSL